MLKNKNVLLVGSVGLIILAIGLVAILDRFQSPGAGSPEDIRARAGVVKGTKFVGVVVTVDDSNQTMSVSNVEFADAVEAGNPKNLGVWTVTIPETTSTVGIGPGTQVAIDADSKTVLAGPRTMTALSITPLAVK